MIIITWCEQMKRLLLILIK